MAYLNTIITGTGSYIPTEVVTNPDFAPNTFYDLNNVAFDISHDEISEKFQAITGISERRYVTDDLKASNILPLQRRVLLLMRKWMLKNWIMSSSHTILGM